LKEYQRAASAKSCFFQSVRFRTFVSET